MKKILFIITLFFSFAATAQNFKVVGVDTVTGRPGYLYTQRPLYVRSPLYKPNDSTLGVNALFIGVDSIPIFQYSQTNQTRTVKHGLMDSIIVAGLQLSPSQLFMGVDTVLGGLHKYVGFENYVDPILNTSYNYPSYRLRWFADTAVNRLTGASTGYPAMDLYHNFLKSINGTSGVDLDFPSSAYITGGANAPGNVYGMRINYQSIDFPMGASLPLTIQNSGLLLQNNTGLYFNGTTTNTRLGYVGSGEIGVGVSTIETVNGGMRFQALQLGDALVGQGRQFSVYGSTGAYGGANSAGALHNAGTIAYTNGGGTITGTGTYFSSVFNIDDTISYNIYQVGGTQKARITAITDNTHITISPVVSVATISGLGYWYNYTLDGLPFFNVLYNGTPTIVRPFSTANFTGLTTTIAAGTGAGTSPTVTITGNDISGYITIATGTLPTLNGTIATITFSKALMNIPTSVIITAGNANAAALIGDVYVDQSTVSKTTWALNNTVLAATASTTYIFYYHVTQ